MTVAVQRHTLLQNKIQKVSRFLSRFSDGILCNENLLRMVVMLLTLLLCCYCHYIYNCYIIIKFQLLSWLLRYCHSYNRVSVTAVMLLPQA